MKYPRTLHLPWSPGGTKDDKKISSVSNLLNKKVVITEKMDGSNLCMTKEDVFARSHAGPPKHKSFDPAKALHSCIKNNIPSDHFLFGEWCFAVHDIHYVLPDYFLLFGILIGDQWQSWNYVKSISKALNIYTVPELHVGYFKSENELREAIQQLSIGVTNFGNDIKEGVVIRVADCFNNFSDSIAKWVRKDHPRNSDAHWMYKEIQKQQLK